MHSAALPGLGEGFKVFPRIRAQGEAEARLGAMIAAGQAKLQPFATGTVIELMLLCDVTSASGSVESCSCYAELKVSVGEPSFFWKAGCSFFRTGV
jgi:hypothetical protein